jgi:hypothetical protein
MEFRKVDEPNLRAWAAEEGNRFIEVIEAFRGEWFCFAKIDGSVCKKEPGPAYVSHREAMAWARRFLRGEITPETWD